VKRKINRDDAGNIAVMVCDEVQKITGLLDDDPRIERLLTALMDGPLDDPEISTGEPSSYN